MQGHNFNHIFYAQQLLSCLLGSREYTASMTAVVKSIDGLILFFSVNYIFDRIESTMAIKNPNRSAIRFSPSAAQMEQRR